MKLWSLSVVLALMATSTILAQRLVHQEALRLEGLRVLAIQTSNCQSAEECEPVGNSASIPSGTLGKLKQSTVAMTPVLFIMSLASTAVAVLILSVALGSLGWGTERSANLNLNIPWLASGEMSVKQREVSPSAILYRDLLELKRMHRDDLLTAEEYEFARRKSVEEFLEELRVSNRLPGQEGDADDSKRSPDR